MNKIFLKITIISLALLVASCSGGGGGTSGTVFKEISKVEETTVKQESELAKSLRKCSSDWIVLTNKIPDSVENRVVAMGITGRNCLKIDSLPVLKEILVSYEMKRNQQNVDWVKLSETVEKMESN